LDRLLFIGAALVLIAIIAINGWSLWRRASAAPAATAAPAASTPDQPADVPSAAANPSSRVQTDFVGPIQSKAARPVSRTAQRVAAAPPAATSGVTAAVPARPAQPIDTAKVADAPAAARDRGDRAAAAPAPAKLLYTAEDRDVIPPRALSPQLLGMLSQSSPGVRPDVLMISVVVNEQGTVDSVRAVNTPENIGELVMLTAALSAVKSWQFRPAVKDGTPVKYRQIVPLRIGRPFP
jgi:TonB-like protein